MSNNTDTFLFDVNFGFGSDGVFILIDKEESGIHPPPIEGYFNLLDNTPFLLLNGKNLTLL
jgi:hypothetical protein